MGGTVRILLILGLLVTIVWISLPKQESVHPISKADTEEIRVARQSERALAGDHDAQIWMALYSKQGPEQIKWLEMAANAGHRTAQRNLGLIYSDSALNDPVKSFQWHLKAAQQGEIDSMFAVSKVYGVGKGVAKDTIRSLAWIYALMNLSVDKSSFAEAEGLKLSIERELTIDQRAMAHAMSKTLLQSQ